MSERITREGLSPTRSSLFLSTYSLSLSHPLFSLSPLVVSAESLSLSLSLVRSLSLSRARSLSLSCCLSLSHPLSSSCSLHVRPQAACAHCQERGHNRIVTCGHRNQRSHRSVDCMHGAVCIDLYMATCHRSERNITDARAAAA